MTKSFSMLKVPFLEELLLKIAWVVKKNIALSKRSQEILS